MNIIILLSLLFGCSHFKKKDSPYPPEGLVTEQAAIMHIKASYLLGCVEAFQTLKVPKSFEHCRSESEKHVKSVMEIMEQPR